MIYSLTPEEEGIASEVGYQRQKPYFGKPSKNMNYSEGDIWEMWQHALCAGSELAFARMMGFNDFIPHFNKWKNELDIPNLGEIRYVANKSRGLRYTVRDDESLIYVLMTGGASSRTRRQAPEWESPPYEAVGWMLGRNCMNDAWRYNETTWYVPIEYLYDCDLIHSHIVRR